jgi:hypothetical protein
MRNDIEIRPATMGDLVTFYGRLPEKTVRAVAVLKEGEIACVAGVTIERGIVTAFSDVREGVTAPKITVWRVAKKIADYIRSLNLPVMAVSDPRLPCSDKFLESLGFTRVAECEEGVVFKL